MADEFKRLDRKLVYKGSIIDYYRDTVQVPNGNVVEWDFIGPQGGGRSGSSAGGWENPHGETVEECSGSLYVGDTGGRLKRRRAHGGCGGQGTAGRDRIRFEDLSLLITIRTTVAFCNEKIDIYVAQKLKPGHQHLDEDEYIDVKAFSVEELCEMIYAGQIEDSKTIAAIMSYKNKYC